MERYDAGTALNLILVLLEAIALIQCWNAFGGIDFTYYTIDSNIFLLLSAILYLIKRKDAPEIVQLAKYSSTLSVSITFLVVVFVLYPIYNINFDFLFLTGPNPLMHVACPLIALLSFLFFEENDLENSLKNNLRSLYFTILYAIILIGLNISREVTGPYPFLKVYEQSVSMSVLWILAILTGAFLLSRLMMMLRELNQILVVSK